VTLGGLQAESREEKAVGYGTPQQRRNAARKNLGPLTPLRQWREAEAEEPLVLRCLLPASPPVAAAAAARVCGVCLCLSLIASRLCVCLSTMSSTALQRKVRDCRPSVCGRERRVQHSTATSLLRGSLAPLSTPRAPSTNALLCAMPPYYTPITRFDTM